MNISKTDQTKVLSALEGGRYVTVKQLLADTRLRKHDLSKARLILGARDEIRERRGEGGSVLVYRTLTPATKEQMCAIIRQHQAISYGDLLDVTGAKREAFRCMMSDLEDEGLIIDDDEGYRVTTDEERKCYAIRVARIPDRAKVLEYLALKKERFSIPELVEDLNRGGRRFHR